MKTPSSLKKLNKPAIWALITLALLLAIGYFLPIAEAGEYGPSYTWTPSNTNWTLNFSFTINTDFESNSTHVEFTNITGWDTTYLLVGSDGNISTSSDYNHNITLTNYSDSYTKMNLVLNGNTSVNLSHMVPDTSYDILYDGTLNRSVTSDSNGYLQFYENFTGTVELTLSETTAPPGITGQYNNYTADSNTDITVERLNGVRFEADANQTILNWTCYNSSYYSGNGTTTGRCEKYFGSEGDYVVKIKGSNNNGETGNATWNISVQDTTMSSVTSLSESSTTATSITWSWNNPSVDDHNNTMIYLDGNYQTNVSNTTTSWQKTGLSSGTTYTINTYAVDTYGNGAWNNDSATTDSDDGGGGGGTVNSAPTADFSYTVSDKTVDFTDQSSDSDGVISDWFWEFDDGDTSTTQSPSHTYSSYGSYSVRLTVTDDDGATDDVTKTVSLEPPSSPDFKIVNYTPSLTDYYSGSNSNITFQIWTNLTADNVTWYMNGSELKTDYGVTTSSYNNNSPAVGTWEIYVLAANNSTYVSKTWTWTVTNSTFPGFSNIEEIVGSGFMNCLGNLAMMTVAVFLVLGLMCYGFNLNAKESLAVFMPTVSATTHVSVMWAPLWIKAAFVLGIAFIWYMAYTAITRERAGG